MNKKMEILRSISKEETIVILDTEKEYEELAKIFGGEVMTVNHEELGKYSINPFQVVTENK